VKSFYGLGEWKAGCFFPFRCISFSFLFFLLDDDDMVVHVCMYVWVTTTDTAEAFSGIVCVLQDTERVWNGSVVGSR
jgi:hypothetical protein